MINIYERGIYGESKKKSRQQRRKEQELSSPSLSIMSSNEKIMPRNAQTAKGNFSTDPATTPE